MRQLPNCTLRCSDNPEVDTHAQYWHIKQRSSGQGWARCDPWNVDCIASRLPLGEPKRMERRRRNSRGNNMNPLRSFLFWCGLEFLWLSGLLWFLMWRTHGPHDPDFDKVVFGSL